MAVVESYVQILPATARESRRIHRILRGFSRWHVDCECIRPLSVLDLVAFMPKEPATHFVEPSVDGRNIEAAPASHASRAWPRCEPGFMHYELGASSDYRSAAVAGTRYTPRNGIRKD